MVGALQEAVGRWRHARESRIFSGVLKDVSRIETEKVNNALATRHCLRDLGNFRLLPVLLALSLPLSESESYPMRPLLFFTQPQYILLMTRRTESVKGEMVCLTKRSRAGGVNGGGGSSPVAMHRHSGGKQKVLLQILRS
jgi:hypothetical protein